MAEPIGYRGRVASRFSGAHSTRSVDSKIYVPAEIRSRHSFSRAALKLSDIPEARPTRRPERAENDREFAVEMSHLKRNGDGCYAFLDRRPSITGPTLLSTFFFSLPSPLLSPIPSKLLFPLLPLFKKGSLFCWKRFAKRTPPVFKTMEPCSSFGTKKNERTFRD